MAGQLVLASSSPRRRDLLREAGFEFESISPDITELHSSGLTAREITSCNARRKGLAGCPMRGDAIILAADTVVALDGVVLGKPADLREAREFLRRLSGRAHEVYSSVFIADPKAGRARAFTEVSTVKFRRLNEARITDYFEKINPLDKAGAYAAQDEGAEIIERIDGSFTNVIGLPMERTIVALAAFGLLPSKR